MSAICHGIKEINEPNPANDGTPSTSEDVYDRRHSSLTLDRTLANTRRGWMYDTSFTLHLVGLGVVVESTGIFHG